MSFNNNPNHPAVQAFSAKTSDEFFIAVAKQETHSFIMVGVMIQGKPKLLARVGKFFISCGCSLKGCSHCQAHLHDEGIYRGATNCTEISYSAYAISFQQLLDFIELVEAINALQAKKINHQIAMHKPKQLPQGEDKDVSFTYTSAVLTPKEKPKNLQHAIKNVERINLLNTCRHTAVDILNYTCQTTASKNVSSIFFVNLANNTQLVGGKPNTDLPFYILPFAPNAAEQSVSESLAAQKHHLLIKLYQRLEHLVRLNPDSSHTEKKFNWVKALYLNVAKTQFSSLEALKQALAQWEKTADPEIFTLRQSYCFDRFFQHTSATKQLLTELQHSPQLA